MGRPCSGLKQSWPQTTSSEAQKDLKDCTAGTEAASLEDEDEDEDEGRAVPFRLRHQPGSPPTVLELDT